MPYKQFDSLQQLNAAQPALRLLDVMDLALEHSPYLRPTTPYAPTVSVSATSDATLTVTSLASAGALTAPAINQVAWYGGVPTAVATTYVALPVTSLLPSTNGNVGWGLGDLNQWASAMEFVTDSDKVQITAFTTSFVKHMFQVDGQYVDFVGSAGLSATSADCCFMLTFATKKPRRIRFMIPNLPSKGATLIKAIRVSPGCSFWKPSQSEVMRVGWAGDSYSEGTNGAGTIYPIPNAAWPVLTCELLGLRDCRQVSVGACGYISDFGGARSKLRDQLPRWVSQGPFDLIVFANGYNDSSIDPYLIQAEVLYDLRLARTLHPTTPIVVLGCQAGNGAPTAAQIATENAIKAAVVQFNDQLCKFAPVSTDTPTWLNSVNASMYVDPDLTHPSLAGAEYLSFRSAAAIRLAVQSMV